MLNFTHILSGLQAAIAVVSAREHALTALLVAVWGRIGGIATYMFRYRNYIWLYCRNKMDCVARTRNDVQRAVRRRWRRVGTPTARNG